MSSLVRSNLQSEGSRLLQVLREEWQATRAVVLLNPANEAVADYYAAHGAVPDGADRQVMRFDYRAAITVPVNEHLEGNLIARTAESANYARAPQCASCSISGDAAAVCVISSSLIVLVIFDSLASSPAMRGSVTTDLAADGDDGLITVTAQFRRRGWRWRRRWISAQASVDTSSGVVVISSLSLR